MASDEWMYFTKVESGWLDADIEILDIYYENGVVKTAENRQKR